MAKEVKEKLYRARLIRGKYHEKIGDGDGKPIIKTYDSKKRPVITSTTDLVKAYGREMFEPLASKREAEEPVVEDYSDEHLGSVETETSSGYEFDTMTVAELKEFAAAEEIDIAGVSKKDELINVIKAAVESQYQRSNHG